ncbi:hypothetical protein BKA61DRAFT_608808 [Leptodontidium sp. MPI-SDFR-AT-0119]|nr:hypothetical protein BKA61DRAFT_608808 [Leptodontidium sp. MPI-SDFR-AT-0119]
MSKRPASQELDHDPIQAKKFSHLKIDRRTDLTSIQNFALSILENRNLAQYVRKLTFTFYHSASYPAQALPYTATTPEEQEKETRFKDAIAEQKWEEPEATELLKRLMTTNPPPGFRQRNSYQLFPDAIVALLLPILPNLKHWIVGEIDRPHFVGKAVQRAKDGIFGSISVTHLKIITNTPFSHAAWEDISWRAFEIYANLPSLKSIRGKGIGGIGVEDGGHYEAVPSKASAVREIHLKQCEISGACVSNVINFSTKLEAFTYRFGGRAGDGGIVGWKSPKIAKALTPHRLTMRSLDLDVERQLHGSLEQEIQSWIEELKGKEEDKLVDQDSDEENSDTETLNSADSTESAMKWEEMVKSNPFFPNLTHLRMSIKLAVRFAELSGKKTLAEWLPSSLEELEVVGYRHHEDGEMAEVVRRREELLPNLKALSGVDEYIENGKELACEDDYVASAGSDDEDHADGSDDSD